tara:strand:+ start:375 stop:974 length:600 start_codon:yes stop_codon:yes gene_type:complete
MNTYFNYLASSYLQSNVDSINHCIESYIEDGNPQKCENDVIRPWLGVHGPTLFHGVKDSKKDESKKDESKTVEKKFKEVTSGLPELSMTQTDCEAYSKIVGSDFLADEWPTQAATGCWIHDGKVRYNIYKNDKECGDKYGDHIVKCIQYTNPTNPTGEASAKTIESFINISKKNNERVYVILFILTVFLYFKLRKIYKV